MFHVQVVAQGDGWKSNLAGSSAVRNGQSRLSGVLRAAAEAGGGSGTMQEVLGLLKGYVIQWVLPRTAVLFIHGARCE